MYLVVAVIDDLRELQDVSLITDQFFFLIVVQLDFVVFEEALKEGNGERWELLSQDVVL